MTPEVAVLTLRDLEYIIAVAEHRSFKGAALDCAVTQPALSTQIKKVEQSFNIKIFERTKKQTLVTPIGEKIVLQCKVVLDELETLGAIARGAEKPLEGIFRLGITDTLCQYIIPYLHKPLQKKLPRIELIIQEGYSTELTDLLKLGKIDAAIVSTPEENHSHHSIELLEEPFYLAHTADSPLLQKKDIKLETIQIQDLLFLDITNPMTQDLIELLKNSRHHEDFQSVIQTTSLESLLFMVLSQRKLAFVPYFAARAHRSNPHLRFQSFANQGLKRSISLICRKNYTGKNSVHILSKIIKEKLLELTKKNPFKNQY